MSEMDYTYGEELPLEAVAPLFASAARTAKSISQAAVTSPTALATIGKPTKQVKDTQAGADDDLEEGELLEDGEISEYSSGEAEFVAASLIAPSVSARQEKAAAQPQGLPRDWATRLQPSQSDADSGYPEPSSRLPRAILAGTSAPSFSLPTPPPPSTIDTPSSPTLEFESLIDELYTYGVTCDYLIGKGVTRDRVIGTFAEKGYKLPQHYLKRYMEQLQQWRDHQAGLSQQQSTVSTSKTGPSHQGRSSGAYERKNDLPAGKRAVSPVMTDNITFLPGSSSSTATSHPAISNLKDPSLIRLGDGLTTPPTPNVPHNNTTSHSTSVSINSKPTSDASTELKLLKEELVRKEIAAREALKARRAVLSKQNAQRVESFIEGLISESQVAQSASSSIESPPPPVLAAEAGRQQTPASTTSVASTLAAVSPIGDGLEDYEDTDHEGTAPEVPKAVLPTPLSAYIPSASRPSIPRHASFNANRTYLNKQHRPVATDFEADPSHKLSGVPRWTEQLMQLSRREVQHREMLIDLSDSEDGDDEDDTPEKSCNDDHDEDDENAQLRLAVKSSRLQDSLNHNSYYQVSSFSSTSNTPYPSYSLNNVARVSESTRYSPAPSTSSVPTKANVKKRSSPPLQIRSRGSTPSINSRPTTANATQAAATPTSGAGNAELEAKQAEIRKMLEMIKKLEGRKKEKTKIVSISSPTVEESPDPPTSLEILPASGDSMMKSETLPAAMGEAHLLHRIHDAKKTVDKLRDEEGDIVCSVGLRNDEVQNEANGGGVGGENQSLCVNAASSYSNSPKRDSSSDVAMSISSEGE